MQGFTLQSKWLVIGICLLSIIGLIGVSIYSYQQSARIESLLQDRNYFLNENASSTDALATASSTIIALQTELNALKAEYGLLTEDYSSERGRNEDFEKQIRSISRTVGVLDKLSKTDEELLQKYSKVYFLNEHYVPESLDTIPAAATYDESRTFQLHSKVLPYFTDMVADAKAEGIDLWVVSAYRSFETQAELKGAYTVTYGSGANAFSADQGFSEHQLGTTLDLTTKGLGGGLNGFENTPAYTWLQANAYKYGFVMSYPANNAYYVFEPWHWRFVGQKLAKDFKNNNAYFYDWDQRKIDGYLVNIFD